MIRLRTVQNIKRLNQIVAILVKHGFGEVMDRLNLPATLSLRQRFRRTRVVAPATRATVGSRLRAALEELGPTFVKAGQLLSTRPELLNSPAVRELVKLQAHVNPLPREVAEKALARELDRPLDTVFSSIESEPLASGSLGQVHRARLSSGEEAAVKIQRPGIRPVIESDIDILRFLAEAAEERMPELRAFSPTSVVEELARALARELDYLNELAHISRFSRNHAESKELLVPGTFPALCTPRLLVMQYVEGRHLSELDLAGEEASRVARTLVRLVLKSMFEDGFFHADPHPGNILLLEDGRLALLDYGQMGWLDRRRIHELSDLLVALAAGEAEQVTRSLLALGDAVGMVPEQRVVNQVRALMLRHFSPEAGLVELGPLVEKLLGLALAQQVSVPAEMTLVVKSLMTVEEVVGRLDPQLKLDEEVRPFMRRLVLERLTPRHVGRSLNRYANEMGEMALALPRHAGEVARKLAMGQLTTELRHIGLERLVDALEHGSNRVSFALVIAALIVGSSILTQTGLGPQLWGISSLGLLGYALAALMGVWLLVGIIRSGRL